MFNESSPIRKGAVVSCRFPLVESPNTPGPAARPALIVRVFHDKSDMTWKAIVAYGTSQDTRANTGYEIRISAPEALAEAGLHRKTRFVLSRMRILPINEDFFAYSQAGTPVLGYLEDPLMARLATLCDRLGASSDALRPLIGGAAVTVPSNIASGTIYDLPEECINAVKVDTFFRENMTGRQQSGRRRRSHLRR
jgi:hypothetical protein